MPIEWIDKGEDSISGDPAPERPLSQKQMTGAMNRTVNRTALGPHHVQSAGAQPDGEADGQAKQGTQAEQGQANGKAEAGISPDTPILGGVQKMYAGLQKEADRALAYDPSQFNPFHPIDYLKSAAESPVETYYLGRHIWQGLNAMFDPSATTRANHDLYGQDNAYNQFIAGKGWGGEGGASADFAKWVRSLNLVSPADEKRAYAMTLSGKPPTDKPTAAEDIATEALPSLADPRYLPMMLTGTRGPALVASILGPTIGNAIFDDRHSVADLAWGLVPAILLGGKLPPPVEKALVANAPGLGKLINKLSAAKLAQAANKQGSQDRQKLMQQVLAQTQPEMRKVLAPAWQAGMKPLTKEQEINFGRDLLRRYQTLEPKELAQLMIRDGASLKTVGKMWTKLARMDYDLMHISPQELPLVDPTSYLHELPGEVRQEVDDGHQWARHFINLAHIGPAGHDIDPNRSRFKSLVGLIRTDKTVTDQLKTHLQKVGGDEILKPSEVDLILHSLESSGREAEVAYLSLTPRLKYVRDTMRAIAAGVGQAGEETGTIEARVPNYWPRMGLLVKAAKGGWRSMRSGGKILAAEPRVHRALAVRSVDYLTEERLQVEQAYKTIQEAQSAVTRQQSRVTEGILNGTPWYEIEQGIREVNDGVIPESDRLRVEGIRALAESQPDVARMEAENYAKELIPDFVTGPDAIFQGIDKLGRQLRGIISRRAINDLLQSLGKDGRALAVARPNNSRAVEQLGRQGYRAVHLPGFETVMLNKEYGELLEKAGREASQGLPGWLERMADIEGAAVGMIMYAPRIHGMNMGLRLGTAFVMHPKEVTDWFQAGLLQKGGLSQLGLRGVTQISPDDYRLIPWQKGVLPPNAHMPMGTGFADRANSTVGEIYSDTDVGRPPLLRDMSAADQAAKVSSGAKAALGQVRDLLWGKQSDLWSWVSDFGVMMYWVEYAAALRGGSFLGGKLSQEQAERYAVLRANSWMGHVAPEDTNPAYHAAAKAVLFAPNYWRTWGELLTGYYRKGGGVGWTPDTIKYVVENEIKTAMAAVLFQQVTANALNMIFSGHTIYQNDPGNWGKVEITAPWAIAAFNDWVKLTTPKDQQKDALIDPQTRRDRKGRRLTWENPLARQVTDTEEAMGMLTSSPHWTPETFKEGFQQFAAARLSPVLSSLAALSNIDLYRSVSSGGFRYIDPNHDSLLGWDESGPHPETSLTDLLTAGGDLTPFSYIPQQIQQQVMQGNVEEMQGPFGLPIPKAVTDTFGAQNLGMDAVRSLLIGLTGTNPPHMRSSKTFGVSPTDDQYKAVHEYQVDYTKNMNALSTGTLAGQMPPYLWLAAYRKLSTQHANRMQAIFKHAPEYNNGPLGLVSSWENLYDEAAANGITDPNKLRDLQRQWRSDHSSADFAAVQSELRVNDQKYPMLALYHKTLDAYDNWQSDYAKANNVDLETLRRDLSGYGQVYGDRQKSEEWLRDHPEILPFENAKKSEFEAGNSHYAEAGLMYALFFNPAGAARYLGVAELTPQQVEQAVQQEQVPPAP